MNNLQKYIIYAMQQFISGTMIWIYGSFFGKLFLYYSDRFIILTTMIFLYSVSIVIHFNELKEHNREKAFKIKCITRGLIMCAFFAIVGNAINYLNILIK